MARPHERLGMREIAASHLSRGLASESPRARVFPLNAKESPSDDGSLSFNAAGLNSQLMNRNWAGFASCNPIVLRCGGPHVKLYTEK